MKKPDIYYSDTILVPTDFSETCSNAISHAIKLALSAGFKVCILHVINKETKAFLKKKSLGVDYVEKRLREYKYYYEKKYHVQVETKTVEGSIFEAINQVAEEIKANLMVLGTHGKKGLQHVFGSYALRVVIDSPVPVIVVQKRSLKQGYNNIVFPISNELEPRQKVAWAAFMSKQFNSRIHLFQAYETDEVLNNRLKIITAQITKVLKEKEIPYNLVLSDKPGNFSEQVISYAVKEHADLIMIMTEPNVDTPGFSFSKWSESLMFNQAQLPVMCINPVQLGKVYYEWVMLA
jgi:nucleotide-binding universal stress UspA family protein